MPRIQEFEKIIAPMVEEFFTEWKPHLFPHHTGASWLHSPEYEIPRVIELQAEIEQVRVQAEVAIQEREEAVGRERANNRDWYTLLNGTGNELVEAVIRTLIMLGFEKVIDMDEDARSSGTAAQLREDIQIRDTLPILVVDVKGVQGNPADEEALQADKHATMRMRELKHPNVKALTIINHQRSIPPKKRNAQAYRNEIVGNAEQMSLGLMTTWDLFNILRNTKSLSWPSEAVRPIFYRSGRIDPIPAHYHKIGCVEDSFSHAFCMRPSEALHKGDILAIAHGESFLELTVESLQLDIKCHNIVQ